MIKLLVWLRAYWKALLVVICVIIVVGLVGFLWIVTIRACSELGKELEEQGLKNILEDVWYGEVEK